MRHGFVRAAAVTPAIRVGDVAYNADQIRKGMEEAERAGASIVVFPELCITGYTCSDLFLQEVLLRRAKEELLALAEETKGKELLVFVGLPLEVDGRLYNVAAVLHQGEVKAFIPKTFIPNYSEFYEVRHFTKGPSAPGRSPGCRDRHAGLALTFCWPVRNCRIWCWQRKSVRMCGRQGPPASAMPCPGPRCW